MLFAAIIGKKVFANMAQLTALHCAAHLPGAKTSCLRAQMRDRLRPSAEKCR
jgi:hypothetical protein